MRFKLFGFVYLHNFVTWAYGFTHIIMDKLTSQYVTYMHTAQVHTQGLLKHIVKQIIIFVLIKLNTFNFASLNRTFVLTVL